MKRLLHATDAELDRYPELAEWWKQASACGINMGRQGCMI